MTASKQAISEFHAPQMTPTAGGVGEESRKKTGRLAPVGMFLEPVLYLLGYLAARLG